MEVCDDEASRGCPTTGEMSRRIVIRTRAGGHSISFRSRRIVIANSLVRLATIFFHKTSLAVFSSIIFSEYLVLFLGLFF